ncbi:MAG TPA: hypothetical protein VFF79_20320 [Conexibacter sp.]|jgi:hypothetical protein|nr:hypothetical protein [Conexibacter sp.]
MTTPAELPGFVTKLGDEFSRVAREEAMSRRPRRRSARVRTVVLAALASLLLVGGAGAATGLVPLPGDGPDFVAQDATGQFSPALTAHLSVLTRPRSGADSMGRAASFVAGPDSPAPGSSLRVTVPPPADGTPHASATALPVWLLPTSTGDVSMQVLSPGADGPGSGFAADLQMVEQGRARMSVNQDVIGLAPDGVRTVRITLEGGARVSLPVVANVYGAHLDEAAQGVEFATP